MSQILIKIVKIMNDYGKLAKALIEKKTYLLP